MVFLPLLPCHQLSPWAPSLVPMIVTRFPCLIPFLTWCSPGVNSRFLRWMSCQYLVLHYLTLAYLNWMCLRLLSILDTSKTMGYDGIGPKVLKNCALALYKPLHHLFLLNLSQHYLPTDWRTPFQFSSLVISHLSATTDLFPSFVLFRKFLKN